MPDATPLPALSNRCVAGYALPSKGKPCRECGARENEMCGRIGVPSKEERHTLGQMGVAPRDNGIALALLREGFRADAIATLLRDGR